MFVCDGTNQKHLNRFVLFKFCLHSIQVSHTTKTHSKKHVSKRVSLPSYGADIGFHEWVSLCWFASTGLICVKELSCSSNKMVNLFVFFPPLSVLNTCKIKDHKMVCNSTPYSYLEVLEVWDDPLDCCWRAGHKLFHSLWIGLFQVGFNAGHANRVILYFVISALHSTYHIYIWGYTNPKFSTDTPTWKTCWCQVLINHPHSNLNVH